jgi:hypothetical protein
MAVRHNVKSVNTLVLEVQMISDGESLRMRRISPTASSASSKANSKGYWVTGHGEKAFKEENQNPYRPSGELYCAEL